MRRVHIEVFLSFHMSDPLQFLNDAMRLSLSPAPPFSPPFGVAIPGPRVGILLRESNSSHKPRCGDVTTLALAPVDTL